MLQRFAAPVVLGIVAGLTAGAVYREVQFRSEKRFCTSIVRVANEMGNTKSPDSLQTLCEELASLKAGKDSVWIFFGAGISAALLSQKRSHSSS